MLTTKIIPVCQCVSHLSSSSSLIRSGRSSGIRKTEQFTAGQMDSASAPNGTQLGLSNSVLHDPPIPSGVCFVGSNHSIDFPSDPMPFCVFPLHMRPLHLFLELFCLSRNILDSGWFMIDQAASVLSFRTRSDQSTGMAILSNYSMCSILGFLEALSFEATRGRSLGRRLSDSH